jgi:hypothetical protein
LGDLEEEVKGLRVELVAKADALDAARKELLTKEGLEDRLQHYQAHNRHLSQGLELELAEAKVTVLGKPFVREDINIILCLTLLRNVKSVQTV